MTFALTKRRFLLGAAMLVLSLVAVGLAARIYLTGLAVGAALKAAGASEVRFHVAQASLWRVVVEDIGFLVRLQPFAAKRVSLDRAHWWTPSLGRLQVEQARLKVKADDLTKNQPAAPDEKPKGPVSLPLEEISIDGQLDIQAAGAPDQVLMVKIYAKPAGMGSWLGNTQVTAPGLALKGEGTYALTSGDLAFKLPEIFLDLKTCQTFLQRVVPLPVEDWELEGKFSGNVEGRLSGGKLTAGGNLRLREGRAVSVAKAVTAEGIAADLEFIDFGQVTTKPGTLSIHELRTGQLTMRDLRGEFAFAGSDRIAVSQVSLLTLGGRVSAEPFQLRPSRSELDAVLLVDNISVEEVMALTKDLPAKATGRVNGRVPVRINSDGLHLGTGWLELKPGVQAEIQFNAKGLLTGGSAPGSPGYAVLQKVESGLLKLKISEMRLDIRPPNAPEGRSAQLHLAGEPLDKEVKAPVTFDLNVNGPLEKLINLGMDSRLSFGAGK